MEVNASFINLKSDYDFNAIKEALPKFFLKSPPPKITSRI